MNFFHKLRRSLWFVRILVLLALGLFIVVNWWWDDSNNLSTGDVIPVQIVRSVLGTKMIFESVERDPLTDQVIVKGRFIDPTYRPVAFRQVGACIESSSEREGPYSINLSEGIITKGGEFSFHCDNAPISNEWIYLKIYLGSTMEEPEVWLERDDKLDLKLPNPGRVTVSHGFVLRPRSVKKGVELRLIGFYSEKNLYAGSSAVPVRWDSLANIWLNITNWWSAPASDHFKWTSTTADFTVSDPTWRIKSVSAQSNFGTTQHLFGPAFYAETSVIGKPWLTSDSISQKVGFLNPVDDPYYLQTLISHETNLDPIELKNVILPKMGEVLPIHQRYSFGKAYVEVDSISGPSDKTHHPILHYRFRAVELTIQETESYSGAGFIAPYKEEYAMGSLMEEKAADLELGKDSGEKCSISFIISDEAKTFDFIANPEMRN